MPQMTVKQKETKHNHVEPQVRSMEKTAHQLIVSEETIKEPKLHSWNHNESAEIMSLIYIAQCLMFILYHSSRELTTFTITSLSH